MWTSLRTKPILIPNKRYKIRMVIAVVNDEDIYEEFNAIWRDIFTCFIDKDFDFYNIDDVDDIWLE